MSEWTRRQFESVDGVQITLGDLHKRKASSMSITVLRQSCYIAEEYAEKKCYLIPNSFDHSL